MEETLIVEPNNKINTLKHCIDEVNEYDIHYKEVENADDEIDKVYTRLEQMNNKLRDIRIRRSSIFDHQQEERDKQRLEYISEI